MSDTNDLRKDSTLGEPVRPATAPRYGQYWSEADIKQRIKEIEAKHMSDWTEEEMQFYNEITGQVAAPAVPDAAARLAQKITPLVIRLWYGTDVNDPTLATDCSPIIPEVAALIREAGEMRCCENGMFGQEHECCKQASQAVPPKLGAEQFIKGYGWDVGFGDLAITERVRWEMIKFAEAYAQHVAAGETRRDHPLSPTEALRMAGIEQPLGTTWKDLALKNQEIAQDALRKLAKAESEALKLRECGPGLLQYVEWMAGIHEDDCPMDDTCNCKWKSVNDSVNKLCDLLSGEKVKK